MNEGREGCRITGWHKRWEEGGVIADRTKQRRGGLPSPERINRKNYLHAENAEKEGEAEGGKNSRCMCGIRNPGTNER